MADDKVQFAGSLPKDVRDADVEMVPAPDLKIDKNHQSDRKTEEAV